MQLGSELFDTYARNLRRIFWTELLDRQLKAQQDSRFRLSIVAPMSQITNSDEAVSGA